MRKNENQLFNLATYFKLYNQFLDSSIAKSLNLRKISEKFVYKGARNGVKAANITSKVFKKNNANPERLETKKTNDLFDLNYDEEQSIIQETINQFATIMRANAEKIDDACLIPNELWTTFNELQLAFLQVPESLGGMVQEKSTVTQMMMVETLSYGDLAQAYAFFTKHSVLNAIMQWGTNAQQEALIPEFLNDNPITASIAVNEPVALFSPFELNTKAIKNGNKYILNGKKNMVPLALKSEYILLAAQLENNAEHKLFILKTSQNGVKIHADKSMGLNAAELCEIQLKDVEIDESAILGDDHFNYEEFIAYSKLGWCALAVGCCQAVLDYIIPYANDRQAFGEPISNRQAVAFMIADIKIELDSMRILMQRAVSLAEQGKDFKKQAYLAHILCAEKSMQIGSNGVQLLGGHGFIRDFPVERWYRDLRAIAIGMNGVHL